MPPAVAFSDAQAHLVLAAYPSPSPTAAQALLGGSAAVEGGWAPASESKHDDAADTRALAAVGSLVPCSLLCVWDVASPNLPATYAHPCACTHCSPCSCRLARAVAGCWSCAAPPPAAAWLAGGGRCASRAQRRGRCACGTSPSRPSITSAKVRALEAAVSGLAGRKRACPSARSQRGPGPACRIAATQLRRRQRSRSGAPLCCCAAMCIGRLVGCGRWW